MSTTIDALRTLGLKVNDKLPTSNNIGNVINEIADDYAGGSGSAGVSSIGGVDGAITLGEGLSMSGQELQVSASGGGTQLYKHTVVISVGEGEEAEAPVQIVSLTPTAYTAQTVGRDVNVITILNTMDGENIFVYPNGNISLVDLGGELTYSVTYYDTYQESFVYNAYVCTFVSDTVTAL